MSHDAPDGPRKVLGWPTIWIAGTIILLVTIGSGFLLFVIYPPPGSKEALDIIRTAGTLGVGTGGAAALLLNARKQRSTEEANRIAWKVSEDTRSDAEERRIIELQAQANEQLGSERASVRLGALTLLKRLANTYPDHQQEIVDILCAYLRMPFFHPDEINSAKENEEARGELQVRLTVQRILADHLRPKVGVGPGATANERFWTSIDLDLSGAVLTDFDLSDCHIRCGQFGGAHFKGGTAKFDRTRFDDHARFIGARFEDSVTYSGASFKSEAVFSLAEFVGEALFTSEFDGGAWFDSARFAGRATFAIADFKNDARFLNTQFRGVAKFASVSFECIPSFYDAKFETGISFSHTRVRVDIIRNRNRLVWPPGWVTRDPEAPDDGRIEGRGGVWGYVVPVNEAQPAAADGDGVAGDAAPGDSEQARK